MSHSKLDLESQFSVKQSFVYVVSSEMLNQVQHDAMEWNRVQDDTVLFSCHSKLDVESQFSVKQSLFMWLVLRC
jgi:hypothetical protein